MHLNRRGLRTEQDVVGNIEGVLRIARRVVFRCIERLEVVVIGLDLGTLLDIKAHRTEDLAHLLLDLCKGVTMTELTPLRRHGNIDLFRSRDGAGDARFRASFSSPLSSPR